MGYIISYFVLNINFVVGYGAFTPTEEIRFNLKIAVGDDEEP